MDFKQYVKHSRPGKISFLLVLALLVVTCTDDKPPQFSPLIIWDDEPADNWELAYPIANGRLGAMVFGDFPRERILLNEETIWAKVDPQVMPEDSAEAIEKISKLILQGNYSGADAKFKRRILNGHRPSSYQPLGNLWLTYLGVQEGLVRFGENFSWTRVSPGQRSQAPPIPSLQRRLPPMYLISF